MGLSAKNCGFGVLDFLGWEGIRLGHSESLPGPEKHARKFQELRAVATGGIQVWKLRVQRGVSAQLQKHISMTRNTESESS